MAAVCIQPKSIAELFSSILVRIYSHKSPKPLTMKRNKALGNLSEVFDNSLAKIYHFYLVTLISLIPQLVCYDV